MLSIQDFPYCPRYTWISSFFDDMDSQKVKCHLIIITALLAHDGATLEQIAHMFSMQKNRLCKALVGLRKESFVYDGVDGKLYLRGDRARFLWPSNDLPTDEKVFDYGLLRSLLKEATRREKVQDERLQEPLQSPEENVNEISEEDKVILSSEALELHKKVATMLYRFEQANHLKNSIKSLQQTSSEAVVKMDVEQAQLMFSEAEDSFGVSLQEAVDYMRKYLNVPVRNINPCMVCLQLLEDMSVIHKCGHILCRGCAEKMTAKSKSDMIECPNCKKLGKSFRLYI